jgi:lipopolysaccharide transport system permease protein
MDCFRLLLRHRRLIWDLTILDLKVRYAGSRLGLVWVVLAPLLLLGVYAFLFGMILRVPVVPELRGWDYTVLVATGLLPWVGFSESVTRGVGSVLTNRNLLKSHLFPIELVPVTAVCVGLMGQLIGTAVLLVFVVSQAGVNGALLLLPVLIVLQAFLSLGLVWFLSCVNVLYRDTSQVVGLLMVLLMFVSPIAYTTEMIPPGLHWVIGLNPLAYLIDGYRAALLSGGGIDWVQLSVLGGIATAVLLLGYESFKRLRRVLPDYA